MNLVEQRTMGIQPGTSVFFCCSVFLRVVLCVLCFYMCLFDCKKLKKTRRTHKNSKKKQTTMIKNKNSKKNKQTTEIQNIQPSTRPPAHEPPRNIHISKGLAGIFSFFVLFFLYVFLKVFMFFVFICVCSIVNAKA